MGQGALASRHALTGRPTRPLHDPLAVAVVPDVHDLLGQAQQRRPVGDALEGHEADVSQRSRKPGTGLTVVWIDTNVIDHGEPPV